MSRYLTKEFIITHHFIFFSDILFKKLLIGDGGT
jgi:hypothetical protein